MDEQYHVMWGMESLNGPCGLSEAKAYYHELQACPFRAPEAKEAIYIASETTDGHLEILD